MVISTPEAPWSRIRHHQTQVPWNVLRGSSQSKTHRSWSKNFARHCGDILHFCFKGYVNSIHSSQCRIYQYVKTCCSPHLLRNPWKANAKMQQEMAEMKRNVAKGSSRSAGSAYETPPPKVSAPSPKPKVKINPPPELKAPETEGARLNRLRRLCEMKPSGRCNVPEAIHLRWKNSNREEKEAMIDELDRNGWSKDIVSYLWYNIPCHSLYQVFVLTSVLGNYFHETLFVIALFSGPFHFQNDEDLVENHQAQ
jgi:hypothetical protein